MDLETDGVNLLDVFNSMYVILHTYSNDIIEVYNDRIKQQS